MPDVRVAAPEARLAANFARQERLQKTNDFKEGVRAMG
jgi:hypothetical protein